MNTILQKRIEEAAFQESSMSKYDTVQESNAAYNAAIKVATFALQNQWISVEEALPEKIKDKNYSEYVLARQEYYEHEFHVIARYDYGFNMWVSTMYFKPEFITHWMPIPSLKGGEK